MTGSAGGQVFAGAGAVVAGLGLVEVALQLAA